MVHGKPEQKNDVRAEDGGGRMDRHHEPHRAAMRHRSRPAAHQGGQAGRRQLQDHQAPRSSSPPASTISLRTSSIWCWRASKARPPASRACRCSWCRRSWSMPTARWARATASSCGSIEHKMGIHGNSTCVMNYDDATGWLIGEENKGMQGMFVMMNEARLGVARAGAGAVRSRLSERRQPMRANGCRAARCRARRRRTSRPTRSSCIPTCAACC